METDGYRELADAVIMLAVEDYRYALRRLRKRPDNPRAAKLALSCERFFRSRWFGILTGTEPKALIDQLRREAAE